MAQWEKFEKDHFRSKSLYAQIKWLKNRVILHFDKPLPSFILFLFKSHFYANKFPFVRRLLIIDYEKLRQFRRRTKLSHLHVLVPESSYYRMWALVLSILPTQLYQEQTDVPCLQSLSHTVTPFLFRICDHPPQDQVLAEVLELVQGKSKDKGQV